MRRAALFVLAGLVALAGASTSRAEPPAQGRSVALASRSELAPVCRSLEAELRSIRVEARLLEGDPTAAETAARAAGATVLVLCEAEPPRIVLRFLDGSWPTDPAYVITIDPAAPDAAESAVLDTSEWLRARLSAPDAPAPEPPPAPPAPSERAPLPPWRRPYVYAGTLHDAIVQPRFIKPLLALGVGFFPVSGLHLFAQLSPQVYRIEDTAAGIAYRVSADHAQLGVGYLQPIRRGRVAIVADARFGAIRFHGEGASGPRLLGQDDVLFLPIVLAGGGVFVRTRGPVAFRVTAGIRTHLRDVYFTVADTIVRAAEAHGYALQWQMEVGL